VRDAAATLRECLASLAAQTLSDHEVVAVDDHARDGSRAILEEAARRDPRVHVLDNPGEGLVAALNAARKAARAPLLARMDADDVCHPDRLRAQVACLQADPALSVLGTCVRLVGTAGRSEGMQAYVRWLNRLLDHDAIVRDLFVESPLAHPSVMMRAEMLARLGGYRAFDGPEDYDLWLRAHAAGARFAKLPDVLLDWRDGPGRLSRTDPRYAPARFRDLKLRALEAGALAHRPAVVWGRGSGGEGVVARLARPRTRGGRFRRSPSGPAGTAHPRRSRRARRGGGGHCGRSPPRRRGPAGRPRGDPAPRRAPWPARRVGPDRGGVVIILAHAPMTSLILGLLLAAPPSPPPPVPRMEKLTRILPARTARPHHGRQLGLADSDRSVRRRAALAAGRIGDPGAVPALVPLLQDPELEVRQMTAFALGLIGDALAVDPLLAALKDPEPVVRARAAEALGQIGDARAAPAIAQMVVAALPPKAPLVTVRGDDPASMTDPWLEPRLGVFALAPPQRRAQRAGRAPLRGESRASTGGRRPGRPCGSRTRPCAPSSWPRSPPPIRCPAPTERGDWAR
jgi:hypothetical protein